MCSHSLAGPIQLCVGNKGKIKIVFCLASSLQRAVAGLFVCQASWGGRQQGSKQLVRPRGDSPQDPFWPPNRPSSCAVSVGTEGEEEKEGVGAGR